LILKLGKCFSC